MAHPFPLLTRVLALVLATAVTAEGGWLKPDVDFSNYDVPLYQQVARRIQRKISARLGDGPNPRDRYFIIPFAYENCGNDPAYSHSFISVIRVFADGQQPQRTRGLKQHVHRDREFEAFTISWLPADFLENPDLCVFNGVGSRIFPRLNQCPISPGANFTLKETIGLAANAKSALAMWGPYEIRREAFDRGVKRKRLLDRGSIKYRADDRLYRKEKIAINCFRAIAGLDELYPNGGLFGTGFKMWGLNGTARVLIEYTEKPSNRALLLEPVDVKKDRYGFVYASRRGGRAYNPVRNASAYWR